MFGKRRDEIFVFGVEGIEKEIFFVEVFVVWKMCNLIFIYVVKILSLYEVFDFVIDICLF